MPELSYVWFLDSEGYKTTLIVENENVFNIMDQYSLFVASRK